MTYCHKEVQAQLIFSLLDRIEGQTRVMAHKDDNISHQLKRWQDGHLPDSYFRETLNKYLDRLNGSN